jgi:hypothetical protein
VKPTKELTQALTNLRGNSDFKVFVEAIQEDMLNAVKLSLRSEGAPCHRAQGEALYCEAVLETIRTAPDTLIKFK